MKKYLLALDQSSQTTGWSLFENEKLKDYGKVDPKGEYLDRIVALRKWLQETLENYKIGSDYEIEVAVEEIQLQQIPGTDREGNVVTFKKLAHVQGVVLELLVEMGITYKIVASSSWKSTCGIKGKARAEQKRNAQIYIEQKYGIKVIQDICDSICIGEHYLHEKNSIIEWD